MKVEIDLMALQNSPDCARALTVMLLSVMPEGEAELAIEEWQRLQDETPQLRKASEFVAAGIPVVVQAEPETVDTETKPGFSYHGKVCSPNRRGPTAALQRGLDNIEACTTLKEFEQLRPEVVRLKDWLLEIGQTEKGVQLRDKINFTSARLINKEGSEEAEEQLALPLTTNTGASVGGFVQQRAVSEAGNGADNGAEPAKPLREFLREAEKQIGTEKLVGLMKQHGGGKIKEITDEPGLRAAVAEALSHG